LRVVIKLGGFLFPLKLDSGRIREYVQLLREARQAGHRMVVVTGGGEQSRDYIRVARELGVPESLCDQIGIESSRMNATLLISCLEDASYPRVPSNLSEMQDAWESGKMVVMGGISPGHSTDAVAALAAETVKADVLIRTTDVDGVYTADPKKDPKARRLDRISPAELLDMVLSHDFWAGSYPLLDPVAIKILDRSNITTWIIDGRDPENIRRVLKGEAVGTLVKR
jgi:uridylate kinase